jgi:tRNA(Ile)-lysidine synthase
MHTDEPREEIASEIAVHVPGTTCLPVRRMEIECRVREVQPIDIDRWRSEKHADQEWIDYERISLPLTVRPRRQGDRFWPLGAPGSKKISEFLIDTKVDPDERERVAILCDRLGPVWIVGRRLDERVKLTRRTRRVLEIGVRRLEDEN